MNVGDIVRFRSPMMAEEQGLRFRILEDRGNRLLVAQVDWRNEPLPATAPSMISPTFVYLRSELEPDP